MLNLEKRIAYSFIDKQLLKTALTHKSYQFENKDCLEHNEKLEFLGDAVLSLVLGEILLKNFKSDNEGGLSKKRASLVNENILSQIALELNLEQKISLGKGETASGGASRPRLLASAFEAVLGALHLDGGYSKAYFCVENLFETHIEKISKEIDFQSDYKTRLQEMVQKEKMPAPVYYLLSDVGPSHDKNFIIEVEISNLPRIKGQGRTKKLAEQNAAQIAIQTYSSFFKSYTNVRGDL